MFGLDLLSVEVLGVLSSFFAGLLSLVPAFGATDRRRALTAVAVLIVAVLAQSNFVFANLQELGRTLAMAAVYSVVSYKILLQPLVLPAVNTSVVAGLKALNLK